jgi:hypothetical protein
MHVPTPPTNKEHNQMVTKCPLCGFRLHNGPPTPAELSAAQARLVDGPAIDRDALDGTIFEGMSPRSLCDFCRFALTTFPEMFAEDEYREMPHVAHTSISGATDADAKLVCDTCGCEQRTDGPLEWVTANRRRALHHISKNATTSNHDEIINLWLLVDIGLEQPALPPAA